MLIQFFDDEIDVKFMFFFYYFYKADFRTLVVTEGTEYIATKREIGD